MDVTVVPIIVGFAVSGSGATANHPPDPVTAVVVLISHTVKFNPDPITEFAGIFTPIRVNICCSFACPLKEAIRLSDTSPLIESGVVNVNRYVDQTVVTVAGNARPLYASCILSMFPIPELSPE